MAGAALVVMTKPRLLFAAPLPGVALSLRDRRWLPAVLATIGTGLGILVVPAYNWHRFRRSPGLRLRTTPVPRRGLAGRRIPGDRAARRAARVLVSPNHGLLFVAPVALLGVASLLRRPIDRVAAVCLGGAVGVFGSG